MNAREQVLLDYGHLYDGQTVAGELCPACSGGGTKEGSLSVTKMSGRLLWHCHRASCGFMGRADVGMSAYTRTTEVPACRGVVGRTIIRESEPLDGANRQALYERFKITGEHITKYGLGQYEGRVSIPVLSYVQEWLGVNLRALDNRQPKTKLQAEENPLSWYVNHTTPDIIIVEDQLSAIRASDFLTSVALLGTHLNQERVDVIKRYAKGRTFLALDKDAWNKTIGYTVKYRSQIKFIPVQLSKDIKNMDEPTLKKLMESLGV